MRSNRLPNVFPAVYSNGLLPGPGANNGENPYVLLTQTGYREKFTTRRSRSSRSRRTSATG